MKRANQMTPALTLYFGEKYDLGDTPLPASFLKVNLLQGAKILALSQSSTLEVPEPLWLRFALKNAFLIFVWKIFGAFSSKKRITVTYAIENNNIKNLIQSKLFSHAFGQYVFRFIVGMVMRFGIDRIVYGSTNSMELYNSLIRVPKIEYKLVEELPAKSMPIVDGQEIIGDPNLAIFIGELDSRKGIKNLMASWPLVEYALPDARLLIVGDGTYANEARTWCEEKPGSREYAGLVAHDQAFRLLAGSRVLLAPSRRSGRWREQIGLPIVEALSLGLTVVTTDETGLSTWLQANGHAIIPEDSVERDFSSAIITALTKPLGRNVVWNSLPLTPGRIEADLWLHSPVTPIASESTKR